MVFLNFRVLTGIMISCKKRAQYDKKKGLETTRALKAENTLPGALRAPGALRDPGALRAPGALCDSRARLGDPGAQTPLRIPYKKITRNTL